MREDIKLRAQYTNVKAENYENYLNMEDVTIKPERTCMLSGVVCDFG